MFSEANSAATASILKKVDKLIAARDEATVERLKQEITREFTALSDHLAARARAKGPTRQTR
jgi:hypothetical protein